jgi:hypothetical protein
MKKKLGGEGKNAGKREGEKESGEVEEDEEEEEVRGTARSKRRNRDEVVEEEGEEGKKSLSPVGEVREIRPEKGCESESGGRIREEWKEGKDLGDVGSRKSCKKQSVCGIEARG